MSQTRANSPGNVPTIAPTMRVVPLKRILSRVDNGDKAIAELLQCLQMRYEVEEKNINFSVKASRMNIYENEIPQSTSEKALGFLKNYFLFSSREKVAYNKELGDSVIKKLDDLRRHRQAELTKYREHVTAVTKDVNVASDLLQKAKKNYVKAQQELQGAKDRLVVNEAAVVEAERLEKERKLSKEANNKAGDSSTKFMGRMLSAFETTPEQERDKQKLRVARRYSKVIACSGEIASRKKALAQKIDARDAGFHMATLSLQTAEMDRLISFRSALTAFCELERKELETRKQFLETLEKAVIDMNVESDIALFVQQEKQVELVHKNTKALALMDWNWHRRQFPNPTSVDAELENAALKQKDAESAGIGDDDDIDEDGDDIMMGRGHDGKIVAELLDPMSLSEIESTATGNMTLQSLANDPSAPLPPTSSSPPSSSSSSSSSSSPNFLPRSTPSPPLSGGTARAQSSPTPMIDTELPRGSKKTAIVSVAAQDMKRFLDCVFASCASLCEMRMHQVTQESDSSQSHNSTFSAPTPPPPPPSSPSSSSSSPSLSPPSSSSSLSESLSTLGFKEDAIANLFSSQEGRDTFLQILDEKRGRYDLLSDEAFSVMALAMKFMLDSCHSRQDVKSAMRVANMANTFHRIDRSVLPTNVTTNKQDNTHERETERFDRNEISLINYPRLYLQREEMLYKHSIWRGQGFWDAALMEGISAQMDLMEPVLWDELTPDALREAVINIHNVIFGQLGTIAFTMHELGLSCEEVESNVLALSNSAQLGEDQEHELLKSIRKTFGRETNSE